MEERQKYAKYAMLSWSDVKLRRVVFLDQGQGHIPGSTLTLESQGSASTIGTVLIREGHLVSQDYM